MTTRKAARSLRRYVGRASRAALLISYTTPWDTTLFGEFAKLVRNRPRDAKRHRAIANGIRSKTIADLINGTVGRPTGHAYFAAGATGLIVKPKRKV